MKKLLLILAMAVSTFSVSAQTEDSPWWLTLELTNNKLDYKWYDGMFNFGQLDNSGFRVGIERYLSPSFDLEIGFSHGRIIHNDILDGNVTDLDLRFVYKFDNGYIFKKDAKVAPYFFAGYGLTGFSKIEPIYEEFNEGTYSMLPLGAGLKFKVVENAEINLRAAYKKSIDYAPNYLQYAIGVSFSVSGKKDSDGDGIYDKEDMCPTEAGPLENKGCPWPDTDGDGVLDKDDACPTTAGTLNGCPDTDGDGIKDSEDACPTVAGIAKFNGCPDTDGDGIQDSEDACPTVAGTLNGCPDTDGDGVKDSLDACPTVAGTLNGCPDSDGDGVKDSDDNCPETAGLASNNGCPEVKEEVKKVLDLAVKDIQFNSGSDVLKSSANGSLDQVVELMKAEDFSLELSGYTDSTGDAAKNLDLSKRRANAVKQYLMNKGIASSRLFADGYGIVNPIADNKTAIGRASNRRVELKIIFR
tara:strand:- start:5008 stop:6417 length:1410 start_codon:yes stop_codon:yes gene_type:complete